MEKSPELNLSESHTIARVVNEFFDDNKNWKELVDKDFPEFPKITDEVREKTVKLSHRYRT